MTNEQNSRLVPDDSTPEEKAKILEELLKPPEKTQGGGSDGLITKSGNDYLFTNISYQDRIIPVVNFGGQLLDNGAQRTQQQWVDFSQRDKQGWNAADMEILYQCMLRTYEFRNDAKHASVVQELVGFFQKMFNSSVLYKLTLTKVSYNNGLDAIVSRLGKFPGTTQETKLQIPEFTRYNDDWSYFVLANEQEESKLGTTNALHANAKPVLKALLGQGYEQAGAVFQYSSQRKNGKLIETRLWTPTTTNRNKERVVALGVDSGGRFLLVADDGIVSGRPAFGVREQKKSP